MHNFSKHEHSSFWRGSDAIQTRTSSLRFRGQTKTHSIDRRARPSASFSCEWSSRTHMEWKYECVSTCAGGINKQEHTEYRGTRLYRYRWDVFGCGGFKPFGAQYSRVYVRRERRYRHWSANNLMSTMPIVFEHINMVCSNCRHISNKFYSVLE